MHTRTVHVIYMDVSENNGTPKSSILMEFFIINHPFGVPLFWKHPHTYNLKFPLDSCCLGSNVVFLLSPALADGTEGPLCRCHDTTHCAVTLCEDELLSHDLKSILIFSWCGTRSRFVVLCSIEPWPQKKHQKVCFLAPKYGA